MDELIRYMRASVLLQLHFAHTLSERGGGAAFKPEVLLADAGISTKEIASMLGKSPAAVAKAISRSRASRRIDDGIIESSSRTGDERDA